MLRKLFEKLTKGSPPKEVYEEIEGAVRITKITDGHGNYWDKYCFLCGSEIQIVRPGQAICPECDDRYG